jgi:hypothetical protein
MALAFVCFEGDLVPGEEVECPLPGVAIRRAQAMSISEANAGAVAFVRQSPGLVAFGGATVRPCRCTSVSLRERLERTCHG